MSQNSSVTKLWTEGLMVLGGLASYPADLTSIEHAFHFMTRTTAKTFYGKKKSKIGWSV